MGDKKGFIKEHKKAVIAITIAATIILISIIGLIVFIYILPHDNDIKYDKAIKIAKNDFGCEKVLWIDTLVVGTNEWTILSTEDADILYERIGHFAYYVIGEKSGEEICIVIPSNPKQSKPFIAAWNFDYLFSQIVDKFNENGAGYVADVPDDFYATSLGDYLDFCTDRDIISQFAKGYNIGVDGDAFYERLDIKVVFFYQWKDDEYVHSCIVTQESGELKSYMSVSARR